MTMLWAALLFFFLSRGVASAQTEKVIFNLTEGKFDNPKIPYVHSIVISGVPVKNKEAVDAITLIVRKVTSNDEQELMAKRYQLTQLDQELAADAKPIKFLSTDIRDKATTKNVAELAKTLKANNQSSLAEMFSTVAMQESAPTEAQVTELNEVVEDEIKRLQNAYDKKSSTRIQLQADIIKLEGEVAAVPFFEGTWVRASEGDDEFTFAMPGKLKMAEKYSFVFTIYKKNKVTIPIDELLDPLVSEFNKTLDTQGYYTTASINSRVTATIRAIEEKFFANVYNIDVSLKNVTPKKGFGLPASVVTNLTALIEEFYQAQGDITTDSEIVARNRILIMNAINARSIAVTHHNEILHLIELSGKASELTSALATAGYSPAEISAIIALYNTIRQRTDSMATHKAAAATARDEIQKIFDNIKSLYTAVATVQSTVSTGETDIEGIKISTTYGIGVVQLDQNTIEWFRFLGINLRLDGFDNRLPGKEAYHSYWSRFSVMLGISTTSDMQYKGDRLENTRLGIKPVVGIIWEPIKHMNVGIGAISFIQESASESHKDPKLRPYVSLSFDFNLFNYLIQNE